MGKVKIAPSYFSGPAAFRAWLEKHHAARSELVVGFHKAHTGKPSMTWPESVKVALCFGWIDGIRRSVDEDRYTIRFTPRKARSTWSAVNIRYVEELTASGLMTAPGLAAFERRTENRSSQYSYEQRLEALPEPYAGELARSPRAARFFAAQSPSYRRSAVWWVVSAKQEATRISRLGTLIALSAKGDTIPQFTRRPAAPAKPRARPR